ncbi:hypothetical protein GCM10023193_06050 [Planotetraspora kaengkrachanensis]
MIQPIGRGGMGVVWLAHDALLDRYVAVKEMTVTLDDISVRRIALQEARSVARLAHPAIITVYDVVENEGRLWIVMEFVRDSLTLDQVIRRNGPLSPLLVARIARRLLDALGHAHAEGVLHRDVKPGNVLLTPRRVVLIDFGIAKGIAEETPALLMGTPAYSAPEHIRGELYGSAADLWSLGATLYAAIEGRSPYHAPHIAGVVAGVLSRDPKPSLRAAALRPLLDGLLRRDPTDRLTAEEAAELVALAMLDDQDTISFSPALLAG